VNISCFTDVLVYLQVLNSLHTVDVMYSVNTTR